MAEQNKIVVYKGPGEVAVEEIEYPKLEVPQDVADAMGYRSTAAPHGVILRIVATNICGSDQHMVRGRTTAPPGQTLGHEITGEVVEAGDDVQFIKEGDICSVPFNIACGRCRNCNERKTGVCLNVNPARAGSAYGYVDMGGWVGGQAEYVMVPYADWNLLKFPDRDQAMAKIRDLTMLSDIFPTGYHGCVTAGVKPGSTVYIAGAGPVGIAAAVGAQLLGAAVVIVADLVESRLAQARSIGCETVDVSKGDPKDQIEQILGVPEVDAAVDAVGVEADGQMTIPAEVDRVGWYRFGPAPGAPGSAALAGHVDSREQGLGAMAPLREAAVGTEVLLSDRNGTTTRWRVVSRDLMRKQALPLDTLFRRDGAPRLTLLTCGGPFLPELGSYRDNVVVVAEPVR